MVLVRPSNHHIEERFTVSHLLVAIGNISDLIPREGAFGCQPVVWLIDVQTQGIHSQKKIRSLFILKHISRVNRLSTVDRGGLRDSASHKHCEHWNQGFQADIFVCVF